MTHQYMLTETADSTSLYKSLQTSNVDGWPVRERFVDQVRTRFTVVEDADRKTLDLTPLPEWVFSNQVVKMSLEELVLVNNRTLIGTLVITDPKKTYRITCGGSDLWYSATTSLRPKTS